MSDMTESQIENLPEAIPILQWKTTEDKNASLKLLSSAITEVAFSEGHKIDSHLLKSFNTISDKLPKGTLALAQTNPTPGDLAGNAKQLLRCIEAAEAVGVDAIVFPELSLMSYPIDDVILKHPPIVQEQLQWLTALAKATKNTKALVGFVEPRPSKNKQNENRIGKPFYNSVAVLSNGKIQGIVRKSLLPNYAEFNDYRTFEPSNRAGFISNNAPSSFANDTLNEANDKTELLNINGISYGVSICEDMWNNDVFLTHALYHTDPIEALAKAGAEVMINLAASPSRAQKEPVKDHLLSQTAQRFQTPIVYVNQVGSVDGLNYEGASRAYDKSGKLIARANWFQQEIILVNPTLGLGNIAPLPSGLNLSEPNPTAFDLTHASDLARTYQAIVQGIKDYFKKTGFKRAVLGLSGGLDSSVTAVLLADTLGAENVIGISMPSSITPGENKSDAQTLAENLGIVFAELPIVNEIQQAELFAQDVEKYLSKSFGEASKTSTGKDNVQAMMRALNLRRIGNDYHALPIATSDKSELYMGYATVNGDMSGALAPIGDVLKTKVRALAHWLNDNRPSKNAIPLRVIEKPSGADLKINPKTGQLVTAEEDLMPYPFLDEVIWQVEFHHADFDTLINLRYQYEDILAKEGKLLSKEQKQAWIEKFFRLMNGAVFKWHIAPPILVVDGYGITRSEYRRPIVSKVPAKAQTNLEIEAELKNASLLK